MMFEIHAAFKKDNTVQPELPDTKVVVNGSCGYDMWSSDILRTS